MRLRSNGASLIKLPFWPIFELSEKMNPVPATNKIKASQKCEAFFDGLAQHRHNNLEC